jgi:uncharacterized repeat protein (TIGR01451 family)/fimbrial isopeptide formation D2 family protein
MRAIKMRNILTNRYFGLFGTILAVVAVSLVLALIPQGTAVNTSADNCANPPTTPSLNYWPITYDDVNTPECHDFRAIDAAVYNPTGSPVFSQSESDWQNGLQLNIGQEGVALIYVHNGAANNLPSSQTLAKNVKITTATDTRTGSTHKLSVRLAGDNTNVVNESFTVHTPANAKLEVVPNSGFMYDYQGNLVLDAQNLNLGNSTYTLGDLDACFEYSVFLTYRFKVVAEQPQNTNLSITKEVRSLNNATGFAKSITVDQNERVQYRVVVRNTGNDVARSVTMTDNGTSGVEIEFGSTTVSSATGNLLASNLWQGAIPGTVNLGNLAIGEQRVITYNAKVTAVSGTLVNTATAVASNAPSVSDTASVMVRTITSGQGKLALTKQVKNQSTDTSYGSEVSARTGERVVFKMNVTNTGNATLNNVVISDPIPTGLQFDDSVVTEGTPSYNATTLTVNFGSLAPGATRTLEFAAKVLATGNTRICNVATATAYGVNSVQAQACVNVFTTPKPGTPNIVLSKKAYNDTKRVDATTVNAARGDTITFTLTTTNTGTTDAVNYVITDDLSQVLPLADIVSVTDGQINGSILTYPAITIMPGETVVKQFTVRVKTSLAPTLSFQIKNTYGNTVVINVPGNIVYEAPKTGVAGAAGVSAVAFAGLLTAGVAVVRRGRDILKFIFV